MDDFNQNTRPKKKAEGQRNGGNAAGRPSGPSSGTRSRAGERKSGSGQRTSGTGRNALSRKRRARQLRERRIRMIAGAVLLLLIAAVIAVVAAVNTGRKKPADDKHSEPSFSQESVSGDQEEGTQEDQTGSDTVTEENSGGEGGADEETVSENTQEPLPEGAELVYAVSAVNIRPIPDTAGEILGKLQAGESIVRTADENGWSTVDYNGTTAYISSEFLTTEEPAVQQPENTAAAGSIASKKLANHEGVWDLSTLDTTMIPFGYSDSNRDANMIPTDWAWYESQWGQHHVDWIQETDSNTIYLTMDEGFGNDTTARILDTLKEKNVKIVFFITENFLKDRPDMVQRMIDEGHIIGNHTCTHPNMTSLSLEEAEEQIMRLHNEVKEQFGYEMTLFRFPQGYYSDQTLGLVDNLGYKTVFWTFGYNDYSEEPEIEYAKQETLKYLHPGAIYLLHASSETNTEILSYFIDEVRARGYEFGVYPVDEDR